ncbi:hypothetical protein CPLU01_02550 [Colletotrichum plurivorum]|uniref:Uncharacterized protein n=1 Tax=Colletotrichum plurivorum TaxID=2175906 RepID=A0A8H6NLV1_9PEZI|nr:hypothetical protein CPLU01_02550 [Colletotrichum plurivorum]
MGDNPVGERGRPPDQLRANNRGSEVSRCSQSPAEASLPSLRPSPLSHRRSSTPSYFELDVSYHENSHYTYSTADRSDTHSRDGDPRLLTVRHSSETSHQYGTSRYTTSSLKPDVCSFKNTGFASSVPRGFQKENLTSEVGTHLDTAATLPKKATKNPKRVQDTANTKLEKSPPSPTLFVPRHAVDSPSLPAPFSFASLKHTSSGSNEPHEELSNGKTLGGFEVTDDEVSDSSFSAHPAPKSTSQSASMPKRTGLPARPKSTRPAQDATRIGVGSSQEGHSDPKSTSSETKPRVKENTTIRQQRSTKPLSLGEQLLIRTKKPNIRIEKVPIEKPKDTSRTAKVSTTNPSSISVPKAGTQSTSKTTVPEKVPRREVSPTAQTGTAVSPPSSRTSGDAFTTHGVPLSEAGFKLKRGRSREKYEEEAKLLVVPISKIPGPLEREPPRLVSTDNNLYTAPDSTLLGTVSTSTYEGNPPQTISWAPSLDSTRKRAANQALSPRSIRADRPATKPTCQQIIAIGQHFETVGQHITDTGQQIIAAGQQIMDTHSNTNIAPRAGDGITNDKNYMQNTFEHVNAHPRPMGMAQLRKKWMKKLEKRLERRKNRAET